MKREILRGVTVAAIGLSLIFFVGGCAKKKVDSGAMQTTSQQKTVTPRADTGQGMGTEEPLTSKPWAGSGQASILEGRTTGPMLPVYYDFDRSNIRKDQQSRIKKNAEFLNDNPTVNVSIQGNCDERGTNEYNMALGERRALSAKKYLMNLGISRNRLTTISFGEEKPLNHGHDELAWSQNRRGDFVITSR